MFRKRNISQKCYVFIAKRKPFLCFEFQVDLGKAEMVARRDSGGGNAENQGCIQCILGEGTNRDPLQLPKRFDCDKIATLNKFIINFLSVILSD